MAALAAMLIFRVARVEGQAMAGVHLEAAYLQFGRYLMIAGSRGRIRNIGRKNCTVGPIATA